MKVAILSTFLLLVGFASAQQKMSSVLVDEFGKITCEDFLARSDNFVHRLNQNPTVAGFVVLSGDSRDFSQLLQTTLNVRLGKNIRVTVLKVENDDFGSKFWLIPAGAEQPSFDGGRMVASYPHSYSSLTLFSKEDEGPCSYNTAPAFADVIKSRSDLIGRVVIHGPAMERFDAIDWVLRRLTIENGVPRTRFRIFYKTGKVPYTEFLLAPIQRK